MQDLYRAAAAGDFSKLYLAILSRYPTDEEQKIAKTYSDSGLVNRRQAGVDIAWALINSSEFVYRH